MVIYNFKHGDVVRVALARDLIGIRCKYIGDKKFETEVSILTGGEYYLFRVLGYSGSKNERFDGNGRLHLETVNSKRAGFRYVRLFPAVDIADLRLVSRERKSSGVESVISQS